MANKINLSGKRFGMLEVISDTKQGWLCQCDCGNKTTVIASNLRSNHTKSCGCAGSRNTLGLRSRTHGKFGTSVYIAWANMISRCTNPKNKSYKDYGGRGIKVCKRWLNSFEEFYKDMGDKPSTQHSLDRHPNTNGNYEPSNCRWASRVQQQRNTRRNRFVTINGNSKTMAEWAELSGLSQNVIFFRIQRKWPESRLLEPIKPRYQS